MLNCLAASVRFNALPKKKRNHILNYLENNFHLIFHNKWCRSGVCVAKTSAFEKYTAITKPIASDTSEKTNLIDDRKFSNFMKSEHSINRPTLVNYMEEEKEDENDIEVLAFTFYIEIVLYIYLYFTIAHFHFKISYLFLLTCKLFLL